MRRNSSSAPAIPASRYGTAAGATIGVGVCWDQWYPETARAMMLMGAEVLFYPTAIGTRAARRHLSTPRGLWRRAMVGACRVATSCPWSPPTASAPSKARLFYGSQLHLRRARRHTRRVRARRKTGVLVATLDLDRGEAPPAPPSASSAIAGRNSMGALGGRHLEGGGGRHRLQGGGKKKKKKKKKRAGRPAGTAFPTLEAPGRRGAILGTSFSSSRGCGGKKGERGLGTPVPPRRGLGG